MKLFIGSLVGGIIIFLCQFLSWTVLNLHYPAQQYTPRQDSILSYLNTQFDSSGGYFLPTIPKDGSMDDMKKLNETSKGKPWVQIQYHRTLNTNMPMNMFRSFATNFFIVLFFCWIIAGYSTNSFGKTFIAALLTGFIIFLHASYIEHVWYETFDLSGHLIDYMVSWGITGIWLGWWLNRKRS